MKKMRKAVFLDRDGTIIRHVNFLIKPEQIKILPGAASAIKTLNQLGFIVVVITNQPVVSRGLIDLKGVKALHAVLMEQFSKKGAEIEKVYFCPHHPDSKIPRWAIKCHCRKPKPGLLLKALKDFKIDPKKSFMIGDAIIDVVAGRHASLKTILVKTGPEHPRLDKKYTHIKPHFITRNLKEAVKIISNEI